MNARKRALFVLAASFAVVAGAAVTVNTWNNSVENGEWAEAANWSTTSFYPLDLATAAHVYAPSSHSGVDAKILLPDASGKFDHFHVLHYAPSTYTFDGEGRTFKMAARDDGEASRGVNADGGSFYPFQVMSESASSSQAFMVGSYNGATDKRDAIFTWSNALMRTTSDSVKDVKVEFLRGMFDFDPDDTKHWNVRMANNSLSRTELVISDATLKCNQFNLTGAPTNNAVSVLAGGRLEMHHTSYLFNSGNYSYAGTNKFSVSGGGQVVFDNGGMKQNALTVLAGSQLGGGARRNEFSVSGAGSVFDMGEVGNFYFMGNTSVEFSDGATAVVPGRFGVGYSNSGAVDDYECLVTISGDDTTVLIATNLTSTAGAGYFYVGNASYSSNRVVMTGGSVKPHSPGGTGAVSLRIASGPASNGTFDMQGGKVDLIVTNAPNQATTCTVNIGPGNGLFEMSGGKLVCGDFYVGANQPHYNSNMTVEYAEWNVTHSQRLHMTGGELNCGRLYLGSTNPNSTFQYQDAHVDLDGGVLKTGSANVYSSALSGGGYAEGHLTANGGTIKPKTKGATLISNFQTAKLGPKGLTIDTTDIANVTISQSFSNKDGEEGRLILTGGGTVSLAPDRYYAVSATVVESGLLIFPSNVVLSTELVITNGATVSLGNAPTTLTVDALTVPNGTLMLDPGDTIHLTTANIDVSGLSLVYNSDPTFDQAYGVFTFDGDVTANAAVRKAMRKIALYNSYAGRHGAFALSYDAASGKTTMTLTVKEDSAPCSDTTAWNGPAWNDGGWSSGVPTSTKVASFSNASAPTTVPVAAGAEVGAMEIASGENYTFTGDALDITGDQGGSFLNVSSGAHAFDLPVNLLYSLPITLSSGTAVSFNGTMTDGAISKTGKGALTLAAANAFKNAVSVGGGLNVVAHEKALDNVAGAVYVTDDTIVFTNAAEDAEMRIATPVVLKSATSTTNAVIVKADSDVVFDDFSVSAGALIKRGRGKMTVNASSAKTTVLRSGHGVGKAANKQVNSSTILSFAEDGSAPDPIDSQYAGFNVAEGELVIKGDASSKQVDLKTAMLVGMYLSGDASTFAQPVLTIDGATVLTSRDSNHGVIGYRSASSGCAVKRSTLRVINGGEIRFATLQIGDTANNAGSYQFLALTNGTVRCENAIRFNTAGQATNKMGAFLRMKDSTFCTSATGGSQFGIYLNGTIDGDIDNSFFGGLNDPVKLQLYGKYLTGELYVHNGSVFAVRNGNISEKSTNALPDFTLAFNDAEWRWGGDDMTITTNNVVGWGFLMDKSHIEMRGTGVIFKPDSGNTLTIAMPFEGAGGLVCDGAGTVKFVRDAWSFSGLLDIRSGTVDLTEADAKPTAAVRGPGTLKGGSFGTLTLKESFANGAASGVPVLDGVTAANVIVDFGADESNPLLLDDLADVTIATYPIGNEPTVGSWRVRGTGLTGIGTTIVVSGGAVRATVAPSGCVMIIK